MCGRYELITGFEELPLILKKDLPKGFKEKYATQRLIRPTDPVIVLKNEGKISTSLMLWGFISEWSKDPFNPSNPRIFNARAETVQEKKLFKASWSHKRCLMPASGFFEKGHRISRKDSQSFWLAGIWNRWMNSEGSELETCCVLTTEPNELIMPLHNRMPVIISYGLEEKWIEPIKTESELKDLEPMLSQWNPNEWKVEPMNTKTTFQMSLF